MLPFDTVFRQLLFNVFKKPCDLGLRVGVTPSFTIGKEVSINIVNSCKVLEGWYSITYRPSNTEVGGSGLLFFLVWCGCQMCQKFNIPGSLYSLRLVSYTEKRVSFRASSLLLCVI